MDSAGFAVRGEGGGGVSGEGGGEGGGEVGDLGSTMSVTMAPHTAEGALRVSMSVARRTVGHGGCTRA